MTVWRRLLDRFQQPGGVSGKWRWMVPWTLAAMGVAVTIAWVLQPKPAAQQQQTFRGPGGPGGGFGGGGPRAGGRQRGADQAAAPSASPSEGQAARAQRGGAVPQGTAVGTAVARVSDINVVLNALGTVTSVSTITLKPQISGQLQAVEFQEGQRVQKGDFLAQIDPRSYELQLKQGEANLARDRVLRDNAQRDLVRYQELQKENAASQQQVETARAQLAQSTAAVAADEVQIGNARLSLTYAHIVSPITGRIGLRQVDAGNYITPADGIAMLTQLDPINVLFTVPEDNLAQITNRLSGGATLEVQAYDRANSIQLATGRVASMDNLIDVTTGTVRIKANFDNHDARLFPNQFVNVRLVVDTAHNVTVLPPAAIQHGAPGAFVFLVKADETVTIQPVKTGISTATMVEVVSGVSAGDQVVIDGVDRMREGTRVYMPNPPMDPTASQENASAAPQTPAANTETPVLPQPANGGRRTRRPAN